MSNGMGLVRIRFDLGGCPVADQRCIRGMQFTRVRRRRSVALLVSTVIVAVVAFGWGFVGGGADDGPEVHDPAEENDPEKPGEDEV